MIRLIRVPILLKDKNSVEVVEISTTVIPQGGGSGKGGGRDDLHGSRFQCTYYKRMGYTQDSCYSFHGFPNKATHVLNLKKGSPSFLMRSTMSTGDLNLKIFTIKVNLFWC